MEYHVIRGNYRLNDSHVQRLTRGVGTFSILLFSFLFMQTGGAAPDLVHLSCDELHDLEQRAQGGDLKAEYALGSVYVRYTRAYNYIWITEPAKYAKESRPPWYWDCVDGQDWNAEYATLAKGIRWLERAAEREHTQAQYELAIAIWARERMYENKMSKFDIIKCKIEEEKDREYNCQEELIWNRNLPKLFIKREQLVKWLDTVNSKRYDTEFSRDIERWLRRAAEKGYIRAQYALATVLIEGVGVSINLTEAQAWRIVAASQDIPFGNDIRFELERMGWLTPQERNEAELLGREFEQRFSDLWEFPSNTIIH